MRLNEGPRLGAAVPLLAALFIIQGLLGLSFVRASSGASPQPPALAASIDFAPHYLVLGELAGTQLVQSQRPRSVPLSEGIQFAATYYTAKDLQNAYNVTWLISQGYGGKGETIAIIDAYGDPTIQQDLTTFDKEFGLPAASLSVIPVGPYEPSNGITSGWDAETALDVETAHAAAPYAHINLVVAANASNALFEAIKLVVAQHLGDVVSMSWGLGENSFGESGFSVAGVLSYDYADYYFQEGASKGMTFFASSGDYGAFDGTTTVTADFPATSPFVTGVGGTTLFLGVTKGYPTSANSSAAYQGEAAWSVSPQFVGSQGVSSGGGYSTVFARPYYQTGAAPSAARSTPDVSADANPYTGLAIVLEGGEYAIGGTSLGSPFWAGMTADMDQYVGRDLGLLNPYLYSVYADKAEYGRDFHQVTSGFNGVYQAGPGYNLVTGLGSPDLPNLAADVKSQSQGLKVSVTTSQGSAASAPSQYAFGEKFTITATATSGSGAVASGVFDANILGPGGQLATVPLAFSGVSWTGSYTPAPGDPPGSWTVEVYGTSGGSSGYGLADVSVGDSLGIVAPVPYPLGPTIEPGQDFNVEVVAESPDGTAIPTAALTAHLVYEGRTVSSVALNPAGFGYYEGAAKIGSGDPQGSYTLVVDSPGLGSVFSYLYVGEAVTGVVLPPLDSAIPSAAPGQQVVLLAKTVTAAGTGQFTSNATAKIYSLSGSLMASVDLHPSPNKAQFGVFNFFGYNQANFTIPDKLAPGFYRIQFLSSYEENGRAVVQLGNFTTGLYVSGPTLSYTVAHPGAVYEGEGVQVEAKIANSTGSPVDSGVFFVTVVPTGYAFESYLTDLGGYTGSPMQYNSTLGAWEGAVQIPSPLTSFNGFVGNLPSLSAGPWTVFVSGESAVAINVVPSASFIDVLPYIYFPNDTLSQSNIGGVPLVVVNGTGYLLSGIGTSNLAVSGVTLTLVDVSIGNLTITDADVRLVGSQVGSITATGSKLALLGGSYVGALNLKSTSLTAPNTAGGGGPSPSALDYLLYAVAVVSVVALAAALLALRTLRRKGGGPGDAPQV